jgi:hypothetical protein
MFKSLFKRVRRHDRDNSAGFHSKLIAKARHRGEKEPYVEQTVGDDLHRQSGHWMKLHRRIDRERKWYDERIADPLTGKVVRECSEPVTAHRDRGSARKRRGFWSLLFPFASR